MADLDHCTIYVSDLAASKGFYDLVFEAIGFAGTPYVDEALCEWQDFSIAPARADRPVTRHLTLSFAAPSGEHVEAFRQAGRRCDPDGNRVEAVRHGSVRTDGGVIDHLLLRTRDTRATRDFYETVAPVFGLVLREDDPNWVAWSHDHGSFSFVTGAEPTEHVHLAFAVSDNAAVDEFHRLALAAGYRNNGAPGERPEYHPGYYGAYVLDPDGHNVEAVCHNRN